MASFEAGMVAALARLERAVARLATQDGPPKNNYGATAAPGVGDDSGDGYQVGSVWVNTVADEAYICCDAQVAAAVWKKIT